MGHDRTVGARAEAARCAMLYLAPDRAQNGSIDTDGCLDHNGLRIRWRNLSILLVSLIFEHFRIEKPASAKLR